MEKPETLGSLVDQMETTRVLNNSAWMTLLRIALESDPERTKAVCREIAERDREVVGIFREIADS